MKKLSFRKTLRLLVPTGMLAFVAIQLVPVDHGNPPVTSEIAASPEVRTILAKACYDCHSNETVWPWYSNIAPISWLVASDVSEGREELNFSLWGDYGSERKLKKFKEILEELRENEMPPSNYLLMHRNAALSPEELQTMYQWLKTENARITDPSAQIVGNDKDHDAATIK